MKRSASFPSSMIATIFITVIISACGGSDDNTVAAAPAATPVSVAFTNGVVTTGNAVGYWNKIATDTINVAATTTGTPEEQRPILWVDLATVHLAIYDAVNAIAGTHKAFAVTPVTPAADASQEAATAAAAYGVLKALFPTRAGQYQAAYDAYVAALADGDVKTRGLAVGAEVATAIVARRANDGRSTVVNYVPKSTPGAFRGVNPVGPHFRYVKPFALTSADQFRSVPPFPLDSTAYATDVNETQAMGGASSTLRSAAQLDSVRLHTEAPPLFLSRNYRQFAQDSRSLADNARVTAMVWLAMADATTACFESKYFYEFWRPTSAITMADTDGNAATTVDASWTPVIATPNHPEYPAAHSCVNSAAMAVVKGFFGTSKISFSFNSTVSGTTVHTYATPDDLINESALARIQGGMHFRNSTVQGVILGTNVGEWIVKNYFQPR